MHNPSNDRHAGQLDVRLSLLPELYQGVASTDDFFTTVQGAVRTKVDDLLRQFGLPGEVVVEVAELSRKDGLPVPFHLEVGGEVCRYPESLLLRLQNYLSEKHLEPGYRLDNLIAAYQKLEDEINEPNLIRFLVNAVGAAIELQPEVLLTPELAESYTASLPSPDWADEYPDYEAPEAGWLYPALHHTLRLGASLADRQAVSDALMEKWIWEDQVSTVTAGEHLVTMLQPLEVEIHIHPDTLQSLTEASDSEDRQIFKMMRDGLYYELGIRYPDFHFVLSETMLPWSVAVKVNHQFSVPLVCIRPDQVFVGESQSNLAALGVPESAMQPAVNPANGMDNCVIEAGYVELVAAEGFYYWNAWSYLVLAVSSLLRWKSFAFLSEEHVEVMFEQLIGAFPELIAAVKEKVPRHQMTRALRALLREGYSIRNMYRILEAVIDYDYIVTDPAGLIVFDHRLGVPNVPGEDWMAEPANLASAIRAGLKRDISHAASGGLNVIPVYLLDPQVETFIEAYALYGQPDGRLHRMPEEEQDELLAAIWEQIRDLSPHRPIHILTTQIVRPVLSQLVERVFPQIRVLAYQDLDPGVQIQQLGRISKS